MGVCKVGKAPWSSPTRFVQGASLFVQEPLVPWVHRCSHILPGDFDTQNQNGLSPFYNWSKVANRGGDCWTSRCFASITAVWVGVGAMLHWDGIRPVPTQDTTHSFHKLYIIKKKKTSIRHYFFNANIILSYLDLMLLISHDALDVKTMSVKDKLGSDDTTHCIFPLYKLFNF